MEDSSRCRALPGHQVRGNCSHAFCVPCFQIWVSWSNNSRTFFCSCPSPVASLRRSSRLSAAQPQASPCCFSPRPLTRRLLALTPVLAAPSQCSPVRAPKPLCGTPRSSQKQQGVKASPGFTPGVEAFPGGCGPEPDSDCIVTNAPAAVSAAEERTAEAADVVLPSICETRPEVCPGAEPTHLSFTLSPWASGSHASTPLQLPAEAEHTSAAEVTILVLPKCLHSQNESIDEVVLL